MILFRVVDSEGFGYKKTLDSEILNWTEQGMSSLVFRDEYFEHRPLPKDDEISVTRIRKYHLFGFKNIEDLNGWFFPADLVLGTILGGKIQVIEISKSYITYGKRQLIFDKRKAKIVSELPMNHFLDDKLKQHGFDFAESYSEGLDLEIEPPAKLSEYINQVS